MTTYTATYILSRDSYARALRGFSPVDYRELVKQLNAGVSICEVLGHAEAWWTEIGAFAELEQMDHERFEGAAY